MAILFGDADRNRLRELPDHSSGATLKSMTDQTLLRRIATNREIFGGKPIIRGMRVSVEMVINLLAQGELRGGQGHRSHRRSEIENAPPPQSKTAIGYFASSSAKKSELRAHELATSAPADAFWQEARKLVFDPPQFRYAGELQTRRGMIRSPSDMENCRSRTPRREAYWSNLRVNHPTNHRDSRANPP